MNDLILSSKGTATPFTTIRFFDHDIRCFGSAAQPWFAAVDIGTALEYTNVRQTIARLRDDCKITVTIRDGNKGNPNLTLINEAALWVLVFRSPKDKAEEFTYKFAGEVMPSLRLYGCYPPPTPKLMLNCWNPDDYIGITEIPREDYVREAKIMGISNRVYSKMNAEELAGYINRRLDPEWQKQEYPYSWRALSHMVGSRELEKVFEGIKFASGEVFTTRLAIFGGRLSDQRFNESGMKRIVNAVKKHYPYAQLRSFEDVVAQWGDMMR